MYHRQKKSTAEFYDLYEKNKQEIKWELSKDNSHFMYYGENSNMGKR